MTLKNLPEISFVSKDVKEIETSVILTYEAIAGRKLAPGDPVRLFLQAMAQLIAHQRVLIDQSAKQNLLAYAREDYLEHLGAFQEVERMPVQPAGTTLRFALPAPLPQTVIIPAGTRVTPDGALYFATAEAAIIEAGAIQVDVVANCTITGTKGNGWAPGQISKLVDVLPWIGKVENITLSSGGTEVEDDDSYRERIHQAPEKLSTAGPDGAYIYWARTAHQTIVDVAVYSPSPGVVEIRPLLENGEIPSQEILDAVEAICNDRSIRPLTDKVMVLAPDEVLYDTVLTYWIDRNNIVMSLAIEQAVKKAVDEWSLWQRSKLGRDINPSELIARIITAGAKRVEVRNPDFQVINQTQVARSREVVITFGGAEDA